jgi:hypothetical protein
MYRIFAVASLAVTLALGVSSSVQAEIEGDYIEARTCDVYTGPCFANGQIGLTGKDAVMAWNVFKGDFQGVDLKGLSVVLVVSGSETLAHQGLEDPAELKSLLIVDEEATPQQRDALIAFAKAQTGKAAECVTSVKTAPIDMKLDTFELCGSLKAGKFADLSVRKAGEDDCICSNERGYYPPLASLENAVPGVATEGQVTARELNTRWSIPGTRSVYLGTFRQ